MSGRQCPTTGGLELSGYLVFYPSCSPKGAQVVGGSFQASEEIEAGHLPVTRLRGSFRTSESRNQGKILEKRITTSLLNEGHLGH